MIGRLLARIVGFIHAAAQLWLSRLARNPIDAYTEPAAPTTDRPAEVTTRPLTQLPWSESDLLWLLSLDISPAVDTAQHIDE